MQLASNKRLVITRLSLHQSCSRAIIAQSNDDARNYAVSVPFPSPRRIADNNLSVGKRNPTPLHFPPQQLFYQQTSFFSHRISKYLGEEDLWLSIQSEIRGKRRAWGSIEARVMIRSFFIRSLDGVAVDIPSFHYVERTVLVFFSSFGIGKIKHYFRQDYCPQ